MLEISAAPSPQVPAGGLDGTFAADASDGRVSASMIGITRVFNVSMAALSAEDGSLGIIFEMSTGGGRGPCETAAVFLGAAG